MQYERLLTKYPILSDQIKKPALGVVLKALETTLQRGVDGAVVEFGCYIGTTSLFIRRLLDAYQEDREFHVYDSFEGLPAKTGHDLSAAGTDFKAGALSVSKARFLQEFRKAHVPPPVTHKAWFNDLTAADIPNQIACAFLDGDFYESILDSLRVVWPCLSPGGIIIIDDYQRETLPGVERAVGDYFQKKIIRMRVEHNIAVISAT